MFEVRREEVFVAGRGADKAARVFGVAEITMVRSSVRCLLPAEGTVGTETRDSNRIC
jgi:hypothetical protein